MKVFRAETFKETPWKNGVGVTREVAVFPETASVDDFLWRVSMANVGADGPFSKFDKIDRTLSVLSGRGIRLQVSDAPAVLLKPTSAPFRFRGDAKTQSWLIEGAITDLNVMTKRDRFKHQVTLSNNVQTLQVITRNNSTIFVIPLSGCRVIGTDIELGPLDALMADDNETVQLQCAHPTTYYMIEISDLGAESSIAPPCRKSILHHLIDAPAT